MFNLFQKSQKSTSKADMTLDTDFAFNIKADGLRVTGPAELAELTARPRSLAEALWHHRGQLVESELADAFDTEGNPAEDLPLESWAALHVPFDSLASLKTGFSDDVDMEPSAFAEVLSDWLPPLTTSTLKVEPQISVLVSPDLRLDLSFWESGQQTLPNRTGPWLVTYGQPSLLNAVQWRLCELVERFNGLENKNSETNYSALAELYEQLGMAPNANVKLEAILEDTVILAPSRLTMAWQDDSEHPESTKSAFPVFLNLPFAEGEATQAFETAFKREFFKHDKAQAAYGLPALALSNGSPVKRVRLMLPPAVQDAAAHMRRNLRGLTPKKALRIAAAPDDQFEGVCPPDTIALDLQTYGPRITGFGQLVFKPTVKVRTLDRVCLLDDGWDAIDAGASIEISATTNDGDTKTLSVKPNSAEFHDMKKRMEEALAKGDTIVSLPDGDGDVCHLPLTQTLIDQFEQISKLGSDTRGSMTVTANPKSFEEKPADHDKHLLLKSNEDQKLHDETQHLQATYADSLPAFERPAALVQNLPNGDSLQLATYQEDGIRWLQHAFLSQKPGVLLADDMGLGKTLQVLTFLAWLFETGWNRRHEHVAIRNTWAKVAVENQLRPGRDEVENPHPVLIVVPKVLMANWETEIGKFFWNEGDIFSSYELLDSKTIKKYTKLRAGNGNDFKTGHASLDELRLRNNRVLIANYDTVKNYYQSFAKIRWSCLVMDESQEIKNPGTAVTHALACIASNSCFKITMTGTPIENDMMDLWSLLDVAASGLLDSQKAFKKQFFRPEDGKSTHGWDVEELKRRLGCLGALKEAQPGSYVLGRSKKDFLGNELPALVDVSQGTLDEALGIQCELRYTSVEWDQQQSILSNIALESRRGKALKAVQQIKLFAEHPWLVKNQEGLAGRSYDTESLLRHSSKFRWLNETLRTIAGRREKVLIFTRSIQMQTWIHALLKERFDVDFRPINGSLSGKKERGKSVVKITIEQFEAHPGFAALVLSPEVAGVGLNITAANHVIHYGRWWNPAKEDQATCRAYRKGQKKPVYLYVPIGLAPEGEPESELGSFDQRLDALLRVKAGMRKDFLTPIDMEASGKDMAVVIPGYESNPNENAQAEGLLFENQVADWMRADDFEQVRTTPASNDWGVDVLGTKGNLFYLVQCKRQLSSNEEVLEAITQAKSYYGSHKEYTNYSGSRRMVAAVASLYKPDTATRNYYESRGIEVWHHSWEPVTLV